MKQNGNTKNMIFNIPTIISVVSQSMTLEVGDIILTGTPAGVGPVKSGQVITCGIYSKGKTLVEMSFPVADKSTAKL